MCTHEGSTTVRSAHQVEPASALQQFVLFDRLVECSDLSNSLTRLHLAFQAKFVERFEREIVLPLRN